MLKKWLARRAYIKELEQRLEVQAKEAQDTFDLCRHTLSCWKDHMPDNLKAVGQGIIDELDETYAQGRSGHTALSSWFGLSYANFLTLPRVTMNAMPDGWKLRMADLLMEHDDAFPNMPDNMDFRVQGVIGSKLVRLPDALTNYRHPDQAALRKWKWQDK